MMPISKTGNRRRIIPLVNYIPNVPTRGDRLDATLFKDFKLSGSFYYANTYNQTFDPRLPVSSGYDKLYVQTGYVRNYGFEAMLSYGHRWGDFSWDSSFTFSANKNEIVELVKDYVHPETGKTYNVINWNSKPMKDADSERRNLS